MTINGDPIYTEISEAVEGFRKRMLERIEKGQQKQKACKIKNVIETKMAQELKLNEELKTRLSELSRRGNDLERVCANFASGLTISDSDQHRLDNAKEMYEIGKKLTGIRFDFSAPPNVVKGSRLVRNEMHHLDLGFAPSEGIFRRSVFDSTLSDRLRDIKCEKQRTLTPFEFEHTSTETLWNILQESEGKENKMPNK